MGSGVLRQAHLPNLWGGWGSVVPVALLSPGRGVGHHLCTDACQMHHERLSCDVPNVLSPRCLAAQEGVHCDDGRPQGGVCAARERWAPARRQPAGEGGCTHPPFPTQPLALPRPPTHPCSLWGSRGTPALPVTTWRQPGAGVACALLLCDLSACRQPSQLPPFLLLRGSALAALAPC